MYKNGNWNLRKIKFYLLHSDTASGRQSGDFNPGGSASKACVFFH